MKKSIKFLRQLGVYGFDHVEPIILASLISEDPILLIGKAGTGKTFLLNSISEALALEHRHYNSSLISFDDLIGFPYPTEKGDGIKFLPTPATIWGSESVLIDELSRCKPETQNKFFSIIHERKIQGIHLNSLRFRWAAMNPCSFEGDGNDEAYEGSMPVDSALADRFAFIIQVPDWLELNKEDQEAVIYPAGENAISNDHGTLQKFISNVRPKFLEEIQHPLPEVVNYCRYVSTYMTEAGMRISPRRARLLARNITALLCVARETGSRLLQADRKRLYKKALLYSLPHRAYKETIPDHVIDASHAETIRLVFDADSDQRWISEFLLKTSLAEKLQYLLEEKISRATKSLAIMQMLKRESKIRIAAFAFAAYPLLNIYGGIDEEALIGIATIAKAVMVINGKMEWQEIGNPTNTTHPNWSECLECINKLPASQTLRRERANQLFLYIISQKQTLPYPQIIEKELNECFISAQSLLESSSSKSKALKIE